MPKRAKPRKAVSVPAHARLFALTVCGFAVLVAVGAPDRPEPRPEPSVSSSSSRQDLSDPRRQAPGEYAAPKTVMTDERFFGRYQADPYADEFERSEQSRGPASRERDVDLDELERYRPDNPNSRYFGGTH